MVGPDSSTKASENRAVPSTPATASTCASSAARSAVAVPPKAVGVKAA